MSELLGLFKKHQEILDRVKSGFQDMNKKYKTFNIEMHGTKVSFQYKDEKELIAIMQYLKNFAKEVSL